ncbi:MAG TPA: hypothetical protein VJA94_09315 [Candidatus Angelobacter sp.]
MTAPTGAIDLKSLAQDLLRNAQHQLQRQNRVTPLFFMVTPQEKLMFGIEEPDPEERQEIYANLLAQAREKNALAVVTVSHVLLRSESRTNPAPEPPRAIMVSVSGPGFQTWTLTSHYVRNGDQIVFQPAEEK